MITQTTLQNAARAIECDLWTDPSGANYLAKDGAILRRWEPETSSADSFELMVALGIQVERWDDCQCVVTFYRADFAQRIVYSDNRGADYRMAILLIAAKIGAAL
jgi:hypothetical protein